MAQVNLTKSLSHQEIIDILQKGYPNYNFTDKKKHIWVEAGLSGVLMITTNGKSIVITPTLRPLEGIFLIILLVTIIIPIIINAQLKKLDKEIATPMANYLAEHCEINTNSFEQNLVSKKNANCPHCKNPISYVSNECEWCGSKII